MGISFIYKAVDMAEDTFTLLPNWKESGHYISGIDGKTRTFKTFRKDRVVAYLGDAIARLADPFTPPPPPVKKGMPHGPEIVFTGFPGVQRASLEARAMAVGMKVCGSVTKGLSYLCAGPNAGPTKVATAREQHVFILTQPQFFALIETGEFPDEVEFL